MNEPTLCSVREIFKKENPRFDVTIRDLQNFKEYAIIEKVISQLFRGNAMFEFLKRFEEKVRRHSSELDNEIGDADLEEKLKEKLREEVFPDLFKSLD